MLDLALASRDLGRREMVACFSETGRSVAKQKATKSEPSAPGVCVTLKDCGR